MGFLGPEKNIIKELSLEEDPRSNIDTPKGNYKTSVPKVYAAGGIPNFHFKAHSHKACALVCYRLIVPILVMQHKHSCRCCL